MNRVCGCAFVRACWRLAAQNGGFRAGQGLGADAETRGRLYDSAHIDAAIARFWALMQLESARLHAGEPARGPWRHSHALLRVSFVSLHARQTGWHGLSWKVSLPPSALGESRPTPGAPPLRGDAPGPGVVTRTAYTEFHIRINKTISGRDWTVSTALAEAGQDWMDDVARFAEDATIVGWLTTVQRLFQQTAAQYVSQHGAFLSAARAPPAILFLCPCPRSQQEALGFERFL